MIIILTKQIEFIIFWIAILLLFIVSFMHSKFSKKFQRFIVIFLIILFCFLYSYRTLGMDLRNYVKIYDFYTKDYLLEKLKISNVFSNEYEPLYLCLIYFGKSLSLTFSQFHFFVYLFSTLIFYYYMNKKTNYPLISYFLFMLIMMFHYDLTRFFLAMSFLCIGFFSKNKSIKY